MSTVTMHSCILFIVAAVFFLFCFSSIGADTFFLEPIYQSVHYLSINLLKVNDTEIFNTE